MALLYRMALSNRSFGDVNHIEAANSSRLDLLHRLPRNAS
jgi:hypothetical protein